MFVDFDIQAYLEDCVASMLEADLYNSEFCTMVTAKEVDEKYGVKKWLEGPLRDAHWHELEEAAGEH